MAIKLCKCFTYFVGGLKPSQVNDQKEYSLMTIKETTKIISKTVV